MPDAKVFLIRGNSIDATSDNGKYRYEFSLY